MGIMTTTRTAAAVIIGLSMPVQVFAALLLIQPGPGDGKDTFAWNRSGSTGSDLSAAEYQWTGRTYSWFSYSYFQFDLASLSTGATITSAQLTFTHRVNAVSWPLAQTQFSYSEITSAWDQHSANWSNQPSLGSAYSGTDIMDRDTLVAAPNLGTNVWTTQTSIDITDLVMAWNDGSLANNGLAYWMTNPYGFNAQDHYLISSNYAGDPNWRPTLNISYEGGASAVSVSAPWALFGGVLLGLPLVSRRSRKPRRGEPQGCVEQ